MPSAAQVSVDGRGGGAPGDHDVKTTFVRAGREQPKGCTNKAVEQERDWDKQKLQGKQNWCSSAWLLWESTFIEMAFSETGAKWNFAAYRTQKGCSSIAATGKGKRGKKIKKWGMELGDEVWSTSKDGEGRENGVLLFWGFSVEIAGKAIEDVFPSSVGSLFSSCAYMKKCGITYINIKIHKNVFCHKPIIE